MTDSAHDGSDAMTTETTIAARQNPTDAAMDRHIWPDGDWHHDTCRCGASHPCDAGILARSLSTALEQLDFHNNRANAAIARAEAAERERDALRRLLEIVEGYVNVDAILRDHKELAADLTHPAPSSDEGGAK